MFKRNLLFLSIALIVVALIIGFIALRRNKDRLGFESTPVDTNTNEVVDLEQVNVNLTSEERTAAKGRDTQRLADIKKIQDALESYKKDKNSYPETLEELVSAYISTLPENPSPGGEPYTYTPIGTQPYNYYDISYTLEVGVDDVTLGAHTANPEGVAKP